MKINTVYRKGSREVNEDTIVVNEAEDIYAVIDGATGLGGLPGALASGIVGAELEKPAPLPLFEIMAEANKGLRLAVEKAYKDQGAALSLDQIPKHERSSCSVAAIKLHRNQAGKAISLEYVFAGDCMIFLQHKDSSIRQITYDHVDRLDEEAIAIMRSYWEKEFRTRDIKATSIEELKRLHERFKSRIKNLLQNNRHKLNSPDGYGIIDGDEQAIGFMEYGRIPLIAVEGILLLSDGLKLHPHREEKTATNTWLKAANMAFSSGLEELERHILEIEDSDPACIYYPRLKQHDDKSGILISF